MPTDQTHPSDRCRRAVTSHRDSGPAVLIIVAVGLAFAVRPPWPRYSPPTWPSPELFRVLKHEPVLELALIALGFLLRAIAGAATGIRSRVGSTVAGFGSLFMAAGKRSSRAEQDRPGRQAKQGSPSTRRVLEGYTSAYLRFVWGMAAAVTITAYCLWAFEVAEQSSTLPWAGMISSRSSWRHAVRGGHRSGYRRGARRVVLSDKGPDASRWAFGLSYSV